MASGPPPSSAPPGPGSAADYVLREYLFGNQMNTQDKGIIGNLEDRINSLIKWAISCFFVGITATATLVIDLMVRLGHG